MRVKPLKREVFSSAEIGMVFQGKRLITLWDMLVILADEGPTVLDSLMAYGFGCDDEIPVDKAAASKALDEAERFCDRMRLTITKGRFKHFREAVLSRADVKGGSVFDEFRQLAGCLLEELESRKLVFILPDKAQFAEQEALFGPSVEKAFPSAKEDIRAAGNCLATDLNTAAVFHLMRVMEFGLRMMHKKLVKASPANPNWSALLQDIDKEIGIKDKMNPRPPLWSRQRGFYIECARHFFFFKDKRNHSVHVELPFDEYTQPCSEQARRIFDEVKGFMIHLSSKLKER